MDLFNLQHYNPERVKDTGITIDHFDSATPTIT